MFIISSKYTNSAFVEVFISLGKQKCNPQKEEGRTWVVSRESKTISLAEKR